MYVNYIRDIDIIMYFEQKHVNKLIKILSPISLQMK